MARTKKLRDFGFRTDKRTYVIAEIGLNHGGDVGLAKSLIKSAARAGADSVKFQTYVTEKRAPKGNNAVRDLLQSLELPFEAFAELKATAEEAGVDFFSTSFDTESVNYLESISCAMYKVASFDVVNRELLRAVAATGKPVIMSVGMADEAEIDAGYRILKTGTDKIALLHCVSSYPLRDQDANLAAIYALQDRYDCVIGYSDHTPGIEVPLLAVAAGAQVIEKHYRLTDTMECVDAAVSISEAQMREMVDRIQWAESAFGTGELGMTLVQEPIGAFRRPSA
jgi:N,N'-diacetyllegionaminate synthase